MLPSSLNVKFDSLETCMKHFRQSPRWSNLRNVQIKSLPLLIDGKPLTVDPFLLYQTVSVRGTTEDLLLTDSAETAHKIPRHYPGAIGLFLLRNRKLVIMVAAVEV
jgi:hypothetical protein